MAELGTDLDGITGLNPAMRVISGRHGVAVAIARRLTTPHGSLFYDPDYGHDLRQYLNAPNPGPGILEPRVEDEAEKDERIFKATAAVTFIGTELTVRLVLVDDEGPFPLTVTISELAADVELLEG